MYVLIAEKYAVKNVEKTGKKSGKFGYYPKNHLLCTLFCDSSCKASKKDAFRRDMRLRW